MIRPAEGPSDVRRLAGAVHRRTGIWSAAVLQTPCGRLCARGGTRLPAPAKAEVALFGTAMLGLLKDLLYVVAVIVALLGLALWSGPGEIHLTTGKTCLEIVDRLAARADRSLTPAERTDLANCGVP